MWLRLRGLGGLATGLLARARLLGLALGHLRLVLGLLALETFLRAGLDLGFGRRDGRQTVFAPLDLRRQIHPLRHIALIGGLGQLEHLLHLGFELRFDLLRVPVRQRTVPGGVGVQLGAVQAERAKA